MRLSLHRSFEVSSTSMNSNDDRILELNEEDVDTLRVFQSVTKECERRDA